MNSKNAVYIGLNFLFLLLIFSCSRFNKGEIIVNEQKNTKYLSSTQKEILLKYAEKYNKTNVRIHDVVVNKSCCKFLVFEVKDYYSSLGVYHYALFNKDEFHIAEDDSVENRKVFNQFRTKNESCMGNKNWKKIEEMFVPGFGMYGCW